jgi:hypothetical protein
MRVASGETGVLEFTVRVEEPPVPGAAPDHAEALAEAVANTIRRSGRLGGIVSSNAQFNAWLDRSAADLALLVSDLPTGP